MGRHGLKGEGCGISLREEFNQAAEQTAARLEMKRRVDESCPPKDHLLCEEIRELYTGGHKIDALEQWMYYYSLPLSLPPESRALVDEMLELYPIEEVHLSTEVTASDIRGNPDGYVYSAPQRYLQYRLADGSVHIGRFKLELNETISYIQSPRRFTRKGREEALREAQAQGERQAQSSLLQRARQELARKLTQNPMIVGARGYLEIPYKSRHISKWDHDSYVLSAVIIFEDGIVYDPYPFNTHIPYGALYGYEENDTAFERRLSRPENTAVLHREFSRFIKGERPY